MQAEEGSERIKGGRGYSLLQHHIYQLWALEVGMAAAGNLGGMEPTIAIQPHQAPLRHDEHLVSPRLWIEAREKRPSFMRNLQGPRQDLRGLRCTFIRATAVAFTSTHKGGARLILEATDELNRLNPSSGFGLINVGSGSCLGTPQLLKKLKPCLRLPRLSAQKKAS